MTVATLPDAPLKEVTQYREVSLANHEILHVTDWDSIKQVIQNCFKTPPQAMMVKFDQIKEAAVEARMRNFIDKLHYSDLKSTISEFNRQIQRKQINTTKINPDDLNLGTGETDLKPVVSTLHDLTQYHHPPSVDKGALSTSIAQEVVELAEANLEELENLLGDGATEEQAVQQLQKLNLFCHATNKVGFHKRIIDEVINIIQQKNDDRLLYGVQLTFKLWLSNENTLHSHQADNWQPSFKEYSFTGMQGMLDKDFSWNTEPTGETLNHLIIPKKRIIKSEEDEDVSSNAVIINFK